jgi:hypothetical protein
MKPFYPLWAEASSSVLRVASLAKSKAFNNFIGYIQTHGQATTSFRHVSEPTTRPEDFAESLSSPKYP